MKKKLFTFRLVNISLLISLAFFLTATISCQKQAIEKDAYPFIQKTRVDKGYIVKWNIENANYVKINDNDIQYNPIDSIFVLTEQDTTLKITAYNINGDAVVWFYNLKIEKDQIFDSPPRIEIRTGEPSTRKSIFTQSYEINEYFAGIIDYNPQLYPLKTKITKVIYPGEQENHYKIEAILLDQYGNFVSNLSKEKKLFWESEQSCGINSSFFSIREFQESSPLTNTKILNVAFLLDNSAPAENNQQIINHIINSISLLNNRDIINVGIFNQNYSEIAILSNPTSVIQNLQKYKIDKSDGLSATYKALNFALSNYFENRDENTINIIILISQNIDNSSIIYTVNDIIEKARSQKIPIYTIGIGNIYSSYILNLLAKGTGGNFYSFWQYDKDSLQSSLNEIILSQKYHYAFEIPFPNFDTICPSQPLILSFKNEYNIASDKYTLINALHTPYSPYQSIALFDYKNAEVDEKYYSNIFLLAQILKLFPDLQIELIGNSSKEGDDITNDSLALERAKAVKNKLLEFGISEKQIKVKSFANRKKLFYLETLPWQSLYNRRVDIRWLDPSLEPYEIIAETTYSETDALKKVEFWEKKGFRSYYERYYEGDYPTYKVKIWGFKSYEEAYKTCQDLERKYKKSFVVE